MLRQLIVMRHAKSSWSSAATRDHERPLNGRGRKDAPRMAEALIQRGWWPDAVVSSDSARTRETWARMAGAAEEREVSAAEAHFERGLYLAGFAEVHLDALSWESRWRRVLILGHNPGWQQLSARLCGEHHEMTTANAALLTGHGANWADALAAPWRLEAFLRPRELA